MDTSEADYWTILEIKKRDNTPIFYAKVSPEIKGVNYKDLEVSARFLDSLTTEQQKKNDTDKKLVIAYEQACTANERVAHQRQPPHGMAGWVNNSFPILFQHGRYKNTDSGGTEMKKHNFEN